MVFLNEIGRWFAKYKYQIAISILLFIIGFQFVYEPTPKLNVDESDIDSLQQGEFIRFVYIGSSSCSYSNADETHEMVVRLKKYFREFAHKNDLKFITTGISVDLYSKIGTNFLEKTGPYDEIISGASWYNLGLHYYVWNNLQGQASTPQLLLISAKFNTVSAGGEIGDIIRNEEVLHRAIGIQNIRFLYRLAESSNEKQIQKILTNS